MRAWKTRTLQQKEDLYHKSHRLMYRYAKKILLYGALDLLEIQGTDRLICANCTFRSTGQSVFTLHLWAFLVLMLRVLILSLASHILRASALSYYFRICMNNAQREYCCRDKQGYFYTLSRAPIRNFQGGIPFLHYD